MPCAACRQASPGMCTARDRCVHRSVSAPLPSRPRQADRAAGCTRPPADDIRRPPARPHARPLNLRLQALDLGPQALYDRGIRRVHLQVGQRGAILLQGGVDCRLQAGGGRLKRLPAPHGTAEGRRRRSAAGRQQDQRRACTPLQTWCTVWLWRCLGVWRLPSGLTRCVTCRADPPCRSALYHAAFVRPAKGPRPRCFGHPPIYPPAPPRACQNARCARHAATAAALWRWSGPR
jgi:hypothetical protein